MTRRQHKVEVAQGGGSTRRRQDKERAGQGGVKTMMLQDKEKPGQGGGRTLDFFELSSAFNHINLREKVVIQLSIKNGPEV